MTPHFKIIIRGRKCEDYIKKCIMSIAQQTYRDFDVTISIDGWEPAYGKALTVLREHRLPERQWNATMTTQRVGLTANLVGAIKVANCQDEDVVVIVDGDDWLEQIALEVEANQYGAHKDLLLTYGSYIKCSKGAKTKISRPYKPGAEVRKAPWHASHLKTFKYKLYKQVPEDAFKDDSGNWLQAASDLALMFPMIEMAGLKRCAHVYTPIYWWRDDTPYKTDRKLQLKCEEILRARKPLNRIPI